MTETQLTASPRFEALDHVVPDPDQPRKRFPEGPLQELAENIWHQGLHQPVTVTANPEGDGSCLLFIGERRWRAFQINRERARRLFETGEELPGEHPAHRYERWTLIPVLDAPPMDPADRLLRQVSENDEREELTLYERALAYQRALGLSGLKAKDFAARYGIDPGTLSTFKGLVNAKGPTKLALELGLLNDATAARLFQSLPKDHQEELIQRAEEEDTKLSRVVVQRALDAVEEAQRKATKAGNVSEERSPRTPAERASSSSPAAPAPLPAMGPVITVETLNWLHNHLELLEAGEDDAFRSEALQAFRHAVLHDSAFITIREGFAAAPAGGEALGAEEVLQEA
jgi:ParB family chromosome partitioning protein